MPRNVRFIETSDANGAWIGRAPHFGRRVLMAATLEVYTYGSALHRLRRAQKPAGSTPLYTRFINRPLGRRFAAMAAATGRSPNQLTAFSTVLSLAGIAVLVVIRPTSASCILVFGLLFLAYALDSADGQLARLTGRQSIAGEWLDHTLDMARILLFHLAIAAVLFGYPQLDQDWLWVPLGFLVVSSSRFFALMLAAELLTRDGRATEEPGASLAGGLIQLPSDTGLLNPVVLLLPWPRVFLAAYTALFTANSLLATASFVRKYRALNNGGREQGRSGS